MATARLTAIRSAIESPLSERYCVWVYKAGYYQDEQHGAATYPRDTGRGSDRILTEAWTDGRILIHYIVAEQLILIYAASEEDYGTVLAALGDDFEEDEDGVIYNA
jgi:hypothetical protein